MPEVKREIGRAEAWVEAFGGEVRQLVRVEARCGHTVCELRGDAVHERAGIGMCEDDQCVDEEALRNRRACMGRMRCIVSYLQ